jgi:Rps23 Pro-64 3,4-dihydroxylase Tpa1-like proline 4-hydroxylase
MLDPITQKIGTGLDNIRIIENFVSPEDIDQLLDFCVENEQSPNPGRSYTIDPKNYIRWLQGKYSQKIVDISSEYYKDKSPIKQYDMSDLEIFASFLAYPTGSFLHPHIDIVGLIKDDGDQMEDAMDKWTGHLASIVYLNDDYEGGEISFPELNITIKPKPGTLISFPGNKHYLHEVKKVLSGTRFTLSMWLRFQDAVGKEIYSFGAEK